jgi:AmmeMemoRadiSam system protein B
MRGDLRGPAHAGTFYPASPVALRRLVDDQLSDPRRVAPAPALPGRPVGLVVPHAGLIYSGRVAAAAWSLLATAPPDAIVIAGTNHYQAGLIGVAAWTAGAWRIPLGDVPVDGELASRVVALGDPFRAFDAAHGREHSIEVQLPFIARACPATPIVPLLVSFDSTRDALAAGKTLGELLAALRAEGLDVILVASSDFAHYPPAAEAEAVTQTLLPPLLAINGPELARREAALRRSDMPGLACGMCGIEPVLFSLGAFEAMGLAPGSLLAAATSADVPGGDADHTVGYAAVAFAAVRSSI